jgi:hypothetical protein
MTCAIHLTWNVAHHTSREGQRSLDVNIAVQRAHTANVEQAQRVWQAVSKFVLF